MRWRHTWTGGGRPHDETLVVDDGQAGRAVARVDYDGQRPEDARWRWFWQETEDGAESGHCATQEAAKSACERRAEALG